MTSTRVNPIDKRIKDKTAKGRFFLKFVGIHLASIPEEQAFLDAASSQYPDLNLLSNSGEVKQIPQALSLSRLLELLGETPLNAIGIA